MQKVLLSPIISPPYEGVTQHHIYNYTANPSIGLPNLIATDDSTYPPLINGLEIFQISGVLDDGVTDSNDVKVLALLQSTFDVLRGWSGDPCFPYQYTWDLLSCVYSTPRRVQSLDLGNFNLTGTFPDISSLDALFRIDFHNNSLSGPIPSFLGHMRKLEQL
ncbi:malectin-like carbohydrate-binding domain-containing protein [Artemisia annua]|uniref:Malectin-like carbohydrate-binding domain-containing protein n=1 Tax=Artemisia annua TaxID=35608 RepID=A0A2U1M9X8_ARTAN|nr:malectin-like carbohydrate-binding domain-containing protein [Artemisia annua]